jgi:hypothetical protein
MEIDCASAIVAAGGSYRQVPRLAVFAFSVVGSPVAWVHWIPKRGIQKDQYPNYQFG